MVLMEPSEHLHCVEPQLKTTALQGYNQQNKTYCASELVNGLQYSRRNGGDDITSLYKTL